MDHPHGHRAQEQNFVTFGNEGETIGFAEIAGEFGEQFVGGDADAGGQAAFGKNRPLQFARHRHRLKERFIGVWWSNRTACSRCIRFDSQARRLTYNVREVEIRFINRNLLDEGPGLRDKRHDVP